MERPRTASRARRDKLKSPRSGRTRKNVLPLGSRKMSGELATHRINHARHCAPYTRDPQSASMIEVVESLEPSERCEFRLRVGGSSARNAKRVEGHAKVGAKLVGDRASDELELGGLCRTQIKRARRGVEQLIRRALQRRDELRDRDPNGQAAS